MSIGAVGWHLKWSLSCLAAACWLAMPAKAAVRSSEWRWVVYKNADEAERTLALRRGSSAGWRMTLFGSVDACLRLRAAISAQLDGCKQAVRPVYEAVLEQVRCSEALPGL